MNESIFTLPKDFWLPNEACKSCHNCEKSFTAVSRKHHCRYCGLIFCNKCTKKTEKLDSHTTLERICESCIVTVKSYNEPSKSLKLSLASSFASELDESFEFDQNILDFFQEIQPSIDKNLESSVKAFSEYLVCELIKNFGLDQKWAEGLASTAKQVVETVCPSVRYRKDKMCVNSYVRIASFVDDEKSCRFFQGGVIMKNIANKKMPGFCSWPRILFLDNRVKESQIYTMVDVISEEVELDYIFVRKIEAMSPDVILTSAGLSERILQKLMKNNIAVILNVPKKELKHLARITNAIILKSLNEGHFLERFLGRCKKMEFQEISNKEYLCFTEVEDYTLGGTVILTGRNTENLEKALKKLITGLRNSKLESVFMFGCGCKLSKQVLIEQYTEKITFKTMQVYKEYVCKNLYTSSVDIYTESDMTLGNFLIHLVSMKDESCGKCGNYLKDHITYLIYKQKILKYYMNKGKSINEADYFLSTHCLVCHKIVHPHYLSNSTWEYSLNKFFWNFFTNSSAAASCGHFLFTNIFKFQKGTTQIFFQFQQFQNYTVIYNKVMDFPNKFFNELLQENLNGIKQGTKYLLENLICKGNGIINKVKIELEITNGLFEQWTLIIKEVEKIIIELSKLMKKVSQYAFTTFGTYLEVELMRRILFLDFSRFVSDFDTIEKKIKKIKPYKKQSFLMHTLKLSNFSNLSELDVLHDEDYNLAFSKLCSGVLTLAMGNSYYVSVYEGDSGSIIAHGLNSKSYNEDITEAIGTNFKDFILDSDSSEWNYSSSSYFDLDLKEEKKKFYGENINLTLTIYFPKQFHCLRSARQIANEQFILSVSKTFKKTLGTGKSSAFFMQTQDLRFILKIVEEKELKMFSLMAIDYFSYLYKCLYEKNDSVLNFCLGVYKIQYKNLGSGKSKLEYAMVFETIAYGLDPPYVWYDLKGTCNKRRKVKEGDKRTKMDLNFVEDFGSLPIPFEDDDWNRIKRAVVNDSGFLCKCNVVDYSMLLGINVNKKKIALGIIDYMQQYTLDKVIESTYKTVVGSQVPTITCPENYKHRFCETVLNHYFTINE